MQIHPELLALRRDDTPQRQAQARLIAAMDDWRGQDGPASVLADLARFAQGADLGDCPALGALFRTGDPAAGDLVTSLMAAMIAELGARPLGHVPMRHSTDGITSSLLVGQSGLATLTLVATDGVGLAASPRPVSISYAPGEAWEQVLAGSARAEMVRATPAPGPLDQADAMLEREELALVPGLVLARDCRREAILLQAVEGRLVSLRLHRRRDGREPVREYDLASGRLMHLAAASPAESRWELMVALLGRMGRADAAPLLARMALGTDSPALRWQALRECLGLDTAAGFAALTVLARRQDEALAASAGALRAQLLESWPQLAGLEEVA